MFFLNQWAMQPLTKGLMSREKKKPNSVGHPLPYQMIAQGFSELMNTLDVHMSVR